MGWSSKQRHGFDNEECLMPLGKACIHAVRQAMYPQSAPAFVLGVGENITTNLLKNGSFLDFQG